MILFNDFVSEYQAIKPEIDQAIMGVLQRGWFILGEEVALFEEELAGFLGVKHCVGVASRTDALTLDRLRLQPEDRRESWGHWRLWRLLFLPHQEFRCLWRCRRGRHQG